jgi:predicted lipid-binding transport protein (Tim44 family)
MPRRIAPIAIAASAILIYLAGAPLALAAVPQASSPYQQLVSPQTQQPTTPVAPTPSPTSSSTSNGGLSTGAQVAIFAGALLLIGVIGFVIMRDARRAAPVKARDVAIAGDRPGAGRDDRLRRQRARAKQARKARKRNKRGR